MREGNCPINVAAARSGVSAHVIRKWETRYGAVEPGRTDSRRRLYSEQDVERLQLLRKATAAGHRIGDIARLPTDQLRRLAPDVEDTPLVAKVQARDAGGFTVDALQAIADLDAERLESGLELGARTLGAHGLLQLVIAPLATRIGELWRDGVLTAGHEHFSTQALRSFLQRHFRSFAGSEDSPYVVVGTPAGQLHDLGAWIVAAAARDLGWRVICLGPSLPAAEIAGVAIAKRARAVALSIVYPPDDSALPGELRLLRKLLPAGISIVVGGRAAEGYLATLGDIGASYGRDVAEFCRFLEDLRAGFRPEKGSNPTF